MGLCYSLNRWYFFSAPSCSCLLLMLLTTGAARGTLGTHTQRNPTTGAVVVTWHEIDTSKARKPNISAWMQGLTTIARGYIPDPHNSGTRRT